MFTFGWGHFSGEAQYVPSASCAKEIGQMREEGSRGESEGGSMRSEGTDWSRGRVLDDAHLRFVQPLQDPFLSIIQVVSGILHI